MKKFILLSLVLTGCGEIYTHEIKSVADQCGGIENIHSMWIDAHSIRARCLDGKRVNTKE